MENKGKRNQEANRVDNNAINRNNSCQDESGFSSGNEEDDSKFREIVYGMVYDRIIDDDPGTSGTHSGFASAGINEAVPGAIVKDDKGPKNAKRTIDGYLANILTERLDKDIEMVEQSHCAPAISPKRSRLNKENVVHLLSTSENSIVVVDSDENDEKKAFDAGLESTADHNAIARKKKSKKHKKSRKEYERRAREAAVTTEWVCDQSYTRQWEDSKKENLLKLRLIRKQTNGALECAPDQKNFPSQV